MIDKTKMEIGNTYVLTLADKVSKSPAIIKILEIRPNSKEYVVTVVYSDTKWWDKDGKGNHLLAIDHGCVLKVLPYSPLYEALMGIDSYNTLC